MARRGTPPSWWTALAVAAVLCLPADAHAQDAGTAGDADAAAPATPHRTGAFDAVLPERSPESEPGRWAERFQFGGELGRWGYDLATERFSLYVPAEYEPDGEPYDVVVWISWSDDGSIPPELRRVFDERRLIWISPHDAGNSRHLFPRGGLALDAAESVRRLYSVDRVFVAGLSGGGRMASLLAVVYSDVFDGAFPIIGTTAYMQIRLESTPGLFVPFFPRPSDEILELARDHPFVIMTGSGDYNREECRLTAEAYRRDGFTELHYVEIEGMGHEMPSVGDFGRGLDLMLGS